MKTNEEAIWQIIKDTFTYFQYLFLSKEEKFHSNLSLVKEKYWFQQLVEKHPTILEDIEANEELMNYFLSRKRVRRLLNDKDVRKKFKDSLKIE
ncbi:hypothetical protein FZW96_00260 [Bacillus sp. BGMRC 2118]|nr:hypothetical protein FZW96_00260 [Bacillus sp. BGMRC 2118]